MDAKKTILIVAGGYILLQWIQGQAKLQKANVATNAGGAAANIINSIRGLGSLFTNSANPTLQKPSAASQAMEVAQSSFRRSEIAKENAGEGTLSGLVNDDGLALNPAISSTYDYTKEYWY